MTMTSEDGDIWALLSEPSLTEEQLEASESDDFLSVILEAIKSNEKAVELSPEETAWADSCFTKTSELSDDDWGAVKNALLDALEKPTGIPYDQEGISDGNPPSLHAESVSKHEDVHMEERSNSDDDDDKDSIEACEIADVIRGADEHGKQMDNYATKPEDGDELASFEVLEETAESGDSIFKVWDLDLSFSDDDSELELIKDLKKLLKDKDKDKESTPDDAFPPPPSDNTMEPLSQISMDELVAGLSDLSIQQTSE